MRLTTRHVASFLLFGLMLIVVGCTPVPTPDAPVAQTPVQTPSADDSITRTPGRIVISELIPGVPGNNNYEFIELYNAGTEPVDMRGLTLWYLLADGQEEKQLYRWTTYTEIPGYGHYLLVREGQDVGVMPDALFSTALFERKGGLVLRDVAGETIDALGWGEAATGFFEGVPAQAPTNGASLERLPGAAAGNGQDIDDNAGDFTMLATPNPQSRGSEITPLPAQRLEITANAPMSVDPGAALELQITARNSTGQNLEMLKVVVPLAEGFDVVTIPEGAIWEEENRLLVWSLDSLADGAEVFFTVELQTPWSYQQINWGGYYVESANWPLRAYGALVPIAIEGGAIPIEVARTLEGSVVTVEGIATMYTGGYYAGSTGTKFYLQDETGGIQAYCPGGSGLVSVRIGDRVQVTGEIQIYRDSVEIIPATYPDDVQVTARGQEFIQPTVLPGKAFNQQPATLGSLVTVEGEIVRFEEFSYSYELDIASDDGEVVFVYLDKETNINPEFIDIGNRYRIAGIHELYNGTWRLQPRLEMDFMRVYPPELMAEISAPNSVDAGALVTYTITAYNHTAQTLTDVQITAQLPGDTVLLDILDGGQGTQEITWTIDSLEANGGSGSVSYVTQPSDVEQITAEPAVITADGWDGEVQTQTWLTFVGSGVPIWAIQGAGFSSPYVRNMATTEGIVTGIFPELEGFWIQSVAPDDNPATSEGVFVLSGDLDVSLDPGDLVKVTGKVREKSQQTLVYITSADDIELVEAGSALPQAVELDPPQDAVESRAYYEALEGMLVQVSEPAVAVSPMSQYGEYVIVRSEWGIDRIMRNDPKGMAIFVDDGSSVTYESAETMPYVIKSGDVVNNVIGPLAFTYDQYKIQPITLPEVQSAPLNLNTVAPLDEGQISVATFNAENFFDVKDPHPSSPAKPSISEYRLKVAKTVNTIVALANPTVVAFQEIENIGILEDIAEDLAVLGLSYTPVLIEGFDSRGIDVGYLVREDQVQIAEVSQHEAPEGLTSRPPLWLKLTVPTTRGDKTLHIINNHFTSMSGGELATEPQRNGQAAWNVELITPVLQDDPEAWVIVLGDLNSFVDAPPIDILREGGLTHVYDFAPDEMMYTYVYQGESETLDHILVSESLFSAIADVTVLHSNADFPLTDPEDDSPVGLSDHDPLLVVFDFD